MRTELVVTLLAVLTALGTACGAASTQRACHPILSWSSPAYACEAVAVAEPEPEEPEEPEAPEPVTPPEPEERVVVKEGKIEISEVVQFETGSAVLLPQSEQLLDEVARAILERPEIVQVQIEGHTDARAGDQYNLRLSRDRAESVRKYLIGRGVEAKRLVAKGFGKSRPIADNETEEGRYQNRRVEFKILKRK